MEKGESQKTILWRRAHVWPQLRERNYNVNDLTKKRYNYYFRNNDDEKKTYNAAYKSQIQ